MKITDDDFKFLQAIHRMSALGYPVPGSTVKQALPLIASGMVAMRGIVEKNGMADLYVTDKAKWKLLAGGRVLQD